MGAIPMVSTRTGWPGTGMGDIRYCNDCRTRCLLRRDPSAPVLASDESYLRRAAVNASVDLIRARRAERIVALTEAAAITVEPSTADLRDGLRRALAALSPQAAEIFALRHFED